MEQVLCNSKGAIIARMPRPVVDDHGVLVRVHYSMISVGTEIAPLREALHPSVQTSPSEKAKEYSHLAGVYLGAAIRDPAKAVRRLVEIGKDIVHEVMPKHEVEPVFTRSMHEIQWSKCDASEYQLNEERMCVVTNDSEATYQVMSEIIAIQPGLVPVISFKGEILSGEVSIGILNGSKTSWLGSRRYDSGKYVDKLIFNLDEDANLVIVIANCGAKINSELIIEELSIAALPQPENGLPLSELEDQGWNVGYSAAGEVIEVGAKVSDIAIGDLVSCSGAGKANHAQYVSVPRNLVCKIPKGCDTKAAATTTIGSIAMQGVRRAEPRLGERVVVLGLGLLGQISAQLLAANGCSVIGYDLSPGRVERARNLGLARGESDLGKFKGLVRDGTEGRGADITIITAATKSDAVVNLAMEVTRAKGRVVIVGDVGLKVERAQFYRKEIDLLMSTSYGPGRYDRNYEEEGADYPFGYVRWTMNRNMQSYMDLIASEKIDIHSLIDRVVPLSSVSEIYRELAESTEPPLGILLRYPLQDEYQGEAPEAPVIEIQGHRKPVDRVLNFALVGAGAFGLSMLVPQMQKRKDLFFLRAIVSKTALQGSNFARANQVETLATDIDEVLKDPDIDLVVIATRHSEHASQVIKSLKAGKHVFVEKPLALTWEELDEIAQTYRQLENPPLLMVGFNRRFSPALEKLRAELENRRSPLIINYRLNGGYIPLDSWIQTEDGGGRNLGEACHMYDVFRSLAGAPVESIAATAIDPDNLPYLRNDNFCATLSYQDGTVANLVYTALGPKTGLPKERIEIFCDGEAYLVDDFKRLTKCSNNEVLWSAPEADKGHATELHSFGEAIKTGTNSPISFDQILETTAVSLHIEDIFVGRNTVET